MIASSLAHVALSVPIFALAYGAALLGPEWAAALAVALYWLGRELAQSMRPGAPFKVAWTATSTANLAAPAAAALLVAVVISIT